MCDRLFLRRHSTHTSLDKRPTNRLMCGYHPSSIWRTCEFYWSYLQDYGYGLLTGAEISCRRQLHHQRPSQLNDSSQIWGKEESGAVGTAYRQMLESVLSNDSASLSLFQAAPLVFISSRLLGWPMQLSGSGLVQKPLHFDLFESYLES